MANEAAEGDITYVPDYIKMEPGTGAVLEADFMVFKWSANKESSADFIRC
jgi:hypothetical protein